MRSPFDIIWKLSRQNKIRKITSFPITPRLNKLSNERTRNNLKTEASIKRRLIKKKVWIFFWVLAREKTQIGHDLPPLLLRILCSSLLFVDNLFSFYFQERLCISFSRCPSLETRLFTYALYCSLLRSSRRILPILAFFVTFLRDLLDSLYAVYLLLSLVALSLCIQPIFTGNLQKTSIYQGLWVQHFTSRT